MSGVVLHSGGERFGRLTILERVANLGRFAAWRCVCDCGKETIVRGTDLRMGKTRSCGCLRGHTRCTNRYSYVYP